jgi:hypothetical protein
VFHACILVCGLLGLDRPLLETTGRGPFRSYGRVIIRVSNFEQLRHLHVYEEELKRRAAQSSLEHGWAPWVLETFVILGRNCYDCSRVHSLLHGS